MAKEVRKEIVDHIEENKHYYNISLDCIPD